MYALHAIYILQRQLCQSAVEDWRSCLSWCQIVIRGFPSCRSMVDLSTDSRSIYLYTVVHGSLMANAWTPGMHFLCKLFFSNLHSKIRLCINSDSSFLVYSPTNCNLQGSSSQIPYFRVKISTNWTTSDSKDASVTIIHVCSVLSRWNLWSGMFNILFSNRIPDHNLCWVVGGLVLQRKRESRGWVGTTRAHSCGLRFSKTMGRTWGSRGRNPQLCIRTLQLLPRRLQRISSVSPLFSV